MTEFLVKHFVRNPDQIEKASVRAAYGTLASVVGIICNVLLFGTKLLIGLFLRSVSVSADAFNNLSDAGSSVISLFGVKLAQKPADKGHPFGHGRIEYISALVVAFLILEVGITFLKESIGKIRAPQQMYFQATCLLILLLSLGVKLWLGLFHRKLGERIDSKVMKAVFTDSMGDVAVTGATIVSMLVFHFIGIDIDGYVGIGVALVIIWAGVQVARDTLEPLIGEAIDPKVYHRITDFVESYDGILGSHDLIVHNYGPNRSMASIHAEVSNHADIEVSHEMIDRIERDSLEKLGVFLVVHMDPIETENEQVLRLKQQVESMLADVDTSCSIHDFRVVSGQYQINLIFDMVIPHAYDAKKKADLERVLVGRVKQLDGRYCCVITMEHGFVSGEKDT